MIHRAARKVAGQPAGDDDLAVGLLAGERLARVLVLGRGGLLPLFDRGTAVVSVAFVLHNGIVREALSDGLAVACVGGEVRGDGFWQAELHSRLLCVRNFGAFAPSFSWTRGEIDRDNSLRDSSIQMQRLAQ